MTLSARNLVSRTERLQRSVASRILPQRSVVSRTIPQRSIVSRSEVPGRSCGLSDSYDWADILDKQLTVKKTVDVYDLPDFSSQMIGQLYPGDKIQVWSYVNRLGRTWIMFYLTQSDYNNFNASYLPLQGPPAGSGTIPTGTVGSVFDPKSDDPSILTVQEKENPDIWKNLTKLVSNVALVGGGLLVMRQLFK